ncbi:MAG: cobyrinate a,c-diamide synthase [Desulfamplus sp.]|nr:cobyrinate a,c-diamide synthase [Desulfamplus sp.]
MQCNNDKPIPGVVVAGLKGGTGKTVISLGIAAAWTNIGIKVAPFKKGPDYIDAGWLAQAAGRPCYNLDTFLCNPLQVKYSFNKNSYLADIALVEGNRGLYDGIDTDGHTSTAEIAKLLNLPVLLVLDCTKSTRTMAALLMGCIHFDPHVHIMGVILNQVAGKRHEGKVRDNIWRFCNIPVFGSVPKLSSDNFPERHMGLIPSAEHALAIQSIESAAKVANSCIDLDALYQACIRFYADHTTLAIPISPTPPLPNGEGDNKYSLPLGRAGEGQNNYLESYIILSDNDNKPPSPPFNHYPLFNRDDKPVIGIIKDSAFQFYYPDNLEILEEKGAILKFISPLSEEHIPEVDAIYMGGGFPETHAAQLAANISFRSELKSLAAKGLPIYAECGGLIFLGKSLTLNKNLNTDRNDNFDRNGNPDETLIYPMADILPLSFGLSQRPVGHGYTEVKVVNSNPFFKIGEIIRGHEFRYSHIIDIDYKEDEMAFAMIRGKGIIAKKDGFFKNNVFGTYTHILASSTPAWSEAIIRKALEYKKLHASNPLNTFSLTSIST